MMKTKLIAGLTTLCVLAFPMSALAATQAPACTVAGCQIAGAHTHVADGAACSVSGCQIGGAHTHDANGYACPVSGCQINGNHSHANGHGNHNGEHYAISGQGYRAQGAHH